MMENVLTESKGSEPNVLKVAVFDNAWPNDTGHVLDILAHFKEYCSRILSFNWTQAVLTSTHSLYFEQKYENIRVFYLKIFSFWR